MKAVLLLGQSNMAGRGFLHEVQPICNERIFMLRNGRWQTMAEPVHFDRAVAGVGPAASFAEAWSRENPGGLGLIPCAEGGSSMDEWSTDGALFRHAVSEAKFALENSELTAILWHQGENDSHGGNYQTYAQKLDALVKALRKELSVDGVPFIAGGLGDYLGKTAFGAGCTEYRQINQALWDYTEANDDCYYVTGQELYSNADGIHINAESQRRFGLRYYEAYRTKHSVTEPLPDEKRLVEALYTRAHTAAERKYMALERFVKGELSFEEVMAALG